VNMQKWDVVDRGLAARGAGSRTTTQR